MACHWIFRKLPGIQSRNPNPIGSMYGIYTNIWGILMVNVTIYSIHGSYGKWNIAAFPPFPQGHSDFSIARTSSAVFQQWSRNTKPGVAPCFFRRAQDRFNSEIHKSGDKHRFTLWLFNIAMENGPYRWFTY